MFTNQTKYRKNDYFMSLALQQAYKALGNTRLNPAVGCVITKKNHVISAGFTSFNGRPHAEHNAIVQSKTNLKDSEIYVTLEPCSNFGKTSPCTRKIIRKKIKSVFFSVKDPDPRSYNKCSKQFKKNNIIVKSRILDQNINHFYKSYFKSKKNGLPFVTAKIAASKDFFTKNIKKKWITNKFSRGRVHLMRSNHDCILTSINTVIMDNPQLTCRINGLEKNSPVRVILDKNLKIPVTSNIVKSSKKYRTIIFFNKKNKKKINLLMNHKIKLIKSSLGNDSRFDLRKILMKIKSLGFSRVFLESGLKLTTNFLNQKLVDDFQLFISGKKIGKQGLNSFKRNMNLFLKRKNFIVEKVNLFDDKLFIFKLK